MSSAIERAKSILHKPSAAWDNAEVELDGRTVRLPADRNLYLNRPVQEDLAQLRAAGWDVGERKGPRGIEGFMAVSPIQKRPPRSLAGALGQASGARSTSWTEEAIVEGGSLVFENVSVSTFNYARAAAGKARARGWIVSTVARAGHEPHRIEFQAPRGLVIEP